MNKFNLYAPLILEPSQSESGLSKRFSGIAYAGGFVPGYRLVIDLDSVKLAKKMPLLSGHQNANSAVIGTVTTAGVSDSYRLEIAGELFSDIEEEAEKLAKKAARGHVPQMSVGVFESKAERVLEGQSVSVNGKTIKGPVTVLRNAHIRETSIVPLGADSNTRAAFLAALESSDSEETPVTIEDMQRLIDQANAKLEAEQAGKVEAEAKALELAQKLEALEKKEADRITASRKPAVEALLKATGKDYSDETAAVYFSMTDEQFEPIAAAAGMASDKGDESMTKTLFSTPDGQQMEPEGESVLLSTVRDAHGVK